MCRAQVKWYTKTLFTHPLQSKCANHIFSKRLDLHESDLEIPVQLCIIGPVFEALDLFTRRDHHLATEAFTAAHADREGPENWINVRSTATITMVQHKIPGSFWRLKWSLCWMKRTPRRGSSFLLVCANNSRDKTSIHAFPWNEETVKHFLAALSAELKPSTLTGMFSVFHSQFPPATYPSHLHQIGYHDNAGWLFLPHHPPEVIHRLVHRACTQSITADIGKTFFLFASRLCKVSYPE